ncbi:uncharacterized protein LOC129317687 [Prosopis cineraria]|uniref:uncharacterized protein LOC129317687 n=1 Tax=Prosopis cineraria TaxID=364024 RepID=UPI00240F3BA4|nr:uncharacterized protein LOC129317687 [Prosopis cineraria]
MVELSFVSKAKSAFHSAAAKAEQVLVDLKSERGPDKESPDALTRNPGDYSTQNDGESKIHSELRHLKWRPAYIGIKQDLQDRIKNIRIGRKEIEETDKLRGVALTVPFYEENLDVINKKYDPEAKVSEAVPSVESLIAATKDPFCPPFAIKDSIPPSSVLKQLAIAVEAGGKTKSMKDFIASRGGSSPVHDRAGLRLSAVKALVLREKEDRLNFSDDEKVLCLINSLFDPEGGFFERKISYGSEETDVSSFPRDIHGAPPESLIVKLAEVIGNFKNLREMALFWCKVVVELRKLWSEEQYLPRVPLNEIPDLKSCLLHQQLQVINCCISRKRHRVTATESMDCVLLKAGSNIDELVGYSESITSSPDQYARLSTGQFVARLGAECPAGDLVLLETGEPVYSPVTQEGPLLTEDLIEETEEFLLQTRSVGAACSQLLSDMQAFKAANPGCIMEDFVRWYSPPDWKEREPSAEAQECLDSSDSLSNRGSLSLRMQKEGNLWRELWEAAKPVPAVKQAPLFDEDLAVEGILNAFEDIQPSELFEQLFISLLGLGFAIAEPVLSGNSDFSKVFSDCKDYILVTCQGNDWNEKIDDLCQVYESVEAMLLNPEEALRVMKQVKEPASTAGDLKDRFKRLSVKFGGKEKFLRRPISKNKISNEENAIRQSFSNFFDSKTSLFSKKL